MASYKVLFVMLSASWRRIGVHLVCVEASPMKLPTGESVFDPRSVFFMFRKNLSVAALNARLWVRVTQTD